MYAVDLDLVFRVVPPMEDNGHGIRLTRTFELPFPPSADVAVFSKEWEEGIEEPMGYRLKEITWDVDRSRFLAETEISVVGTPIAMIPHEIRYLIKQGWRYGSYEDGYKSTRKRGKQRARLPKMRISKWDWDEAEKWDTMRDKNRPKEYKLILHAVVSTMAELHNNWGIAYAMLKVGGFVDVPKEQFGRDLSPLEKKFADAVREFEALTFNQGWDWAKRVQRRYPRLIDVVEAMR
jgi:hypothetical protein